LLIVASIYTGFFGPIVSIIAGVAVYAVMEAAFRRRLGVLLLRTTLFLAIIVSLILLANHLTLLLIVAIVGLAVFTLVDNVRDIARG